MKSPGALRGPSARSMKLRSHLLVLIAATLLPMLVFAAIGSFLFLRYQRATFQRGATERTLALLTAVDAELRGSIAALRAFATSSTLEATDLRGFHAEASRVLKSQPDWLMINLTDALGQQLVNTVRPLGVPLPSLAGRSSVHRVVTTKEAVVSNLIETMLTKEPGFAIRVPVMREGRVAYVLSAVISPRAIDGLLRVQRLPPEWVGVVLDGNHRIVSRTVAPDKTVGQPASESLRAALARAPEGWFQGSTIEGARVYTPYNRSSFSGWTVAMGIPAAAVEAATRQTISWLVVGTLAAAGIASLVALALSRRIAAPVTALVQAVQALARGDRPDIPGGSRVQEVGDLARAFDDAAGAVRAREETQGRLAAIVEASSDAIISYSPQGIIQTWNPAAARLFGYAGDDVIGRHVSLLVPPERAGEQAEVVAAVLAAVGQAVETDGLRKDGTRVPVGLQVSPIRNVAGIVTGLMAAVRDITERKRAEEALRAADRAKDEFLAMLGHELRNPLGAIAGAVGVLALAGKLEEGAERARAVIGRQVQHLSRLVDDLLDMSRVSSGKVMLTLHPVDLAELATGFMSAWRISGRFDNHQVTMDATPVWVNADETRMEQVLANLVGNALKYTPAGGRVAVRVAPDGGTAVLEVADTGAGIPAGLIERVFDSFVQGDRGLDRSQGGLGLGLTVVKVLVEKHGGTVHVSSPGPGNGAVFTVRLPRTRRMSQPGATAAAAAMPAPRCVLVIEDNEDAREMVRVALELAGHRVYAAPDGPCGVELAGAVAPDVALIDVGLPGMDGYEVARRIRAGKAGDRTRLIAITGYGQAEDRRRASKAGFDMHLTKPVTPERLLEAIAAAMSAFEPPGGPVP